MSKVRGMSMADQHYGVCRYSGSTDKIVATEEYTHIHQAMLSEKTIAVHTIIVQVQAAYQLHEVA